MQKLSTITLSWLRNDESYTFHKAVSELLWRGSLRRFHQQGQRRHRRAKASYENKGDNFREVCGFVGVNVRASPSVNVTLSREGMLSLRDKGMLRYNFVAANTRAERDIHLARNRRLRPTFTSPQADTTTQEYLEKHFLGKPHLTQFQIELTSKCNERCVHCYISHEFKLYNITDEMYYNTLKQLSEMGVLDVTLSGGEPMCHPHFKKYLLVAKEYDFSVNVLSNLTLLTDEIVEAMKNGRTNAESAP